MYESYCQCEKNGVIVDIFTHVRIIPAGVTYSRIPKAVRSLNFLCSDVTMLTHSLDNRIEQC